MVTYSYVRNQKNHQRNFKLVIHKHTAASCKAMPITAKWTSSVLLNDNVLHTDVPPWFAFLPCNMKDSLVGYSVKMTNSCRYFVVNIYNASGSSLEHVAAPVDGGPHSHSHLAVFMSQPLTVSAFSKPLNVCSLIVSFSYLPPCTRTPLF